MMKLTRFHHLTLRQTNVLPWTQVKVATYVRRFETVVLNVCALYFIIPIQYTYLYHTTTCLYLYILYALEICILFCIDVEVDT